MNSRKQLWILLGVFIASVLLWYIPLAQVVLYPFMLFATFVHELGHALMAIATGGKVINLEVFLDGAGLTTTTGGFRFLILSGGYLGSTIVGAILLILASDDNIIITKISLGSTILIMFASIIFFVRDFFTIILILFFIAMVVLIIIKAGETLNRLFLNFLAIQCCFYSLYNIKTVFGLSIMGHGQNDAAMLAQLTWIPAPIWAIFWAILSFIIFGLVIRFIYSFSK